MNYTEGDIVYHKWALNRAILPETKARHGFHKIGMIIGLSDDALFLESHIKFWDILIDKDITQWREDLIALAS